MEVILLLADCVFNVHTNIKIMSTYLYGFTCNSKVDQNNCGNDAAQQGT